MGLDWNPLARPKPGMEAEFERLFRELTSGTAGGGSVLSRIWGWWRGPAAERDRIERLQRISDPPYVTLGAPRVGIDPAADDWLRARIASGDADAFARAREEMHGFYVLDLLPPCDGFPPYTNHGAYEGLERYSFRGQFLDDVKEIIGPELHRQAWNRMLARELGAYASALEARARPWAQRAGVAHLDTATEPPDHAEHDPAARAHVVFSAIRWCRFWASRGHGLDPWF